jgi:hypothetical protein
MVRNGCVYTLELILTYRFVPVGVSIAIDVGMTIVATLAWFALSAFAVKFGVEAVNLQEEQDHSSTTRV